MNNKKRRGVPSTEDIVHRVAAAITERRLPPGTKLAEEGLGEAFGVSRTKVRLALFQLARDKLITLKPSRGAYVAQPSIREAKEIFEARRVIEAAVVRKFVTSGSANDFRRLRAHLSSEHEALRANDLNAAIKLSGEFHLMLAEMSGNTVLADLLRELVSRTSLIIVLYSSSLSASCSWDEHTQLLTHMEQNAIEPAVQAMNSHLHHIESALRLNETVAQVLDLKNALALAR